MRTLAKAALGRVEMRTCISLSGSCNYKCLYPHCRGRASSLRFRVNETQSRLFALRSAGLTPSTAAFSRSFARLRRGPSATPAQARQVSAGVRHLYATGLRPASTGLTPSAGACEEMIEAEAVVSLLLQARLSAYVTEKKKSS